MNIQFFANRTLARDAARAAGVKPIDNGKDAAPGKRWAIELPAVETTAPAVNVAVSLETSTPAPAPSEIRRAPLSVSFPTGKRFPGKRRQRVTMVTGKDGNKIPVTWRKRTDHQVAA